MTKAEKAHNRYFVDCVRNLLGQRPLYPELFYDWKRLPLGQFNDEEIAAMVSGVSATEVSNARRRLKIPGCRHHQSIQHGESALTRRAL